MINQCMWRLVEELRANDVPSPLSQCLTLATVWDDLCRLNGEESPAVVQTLLIGDACSATPAPRRGTGDPAPRQAGIG